MSVNELVLSSFNSLSTDVDNIYSSAKHKTLNSWKTTQRSLVTGSGAAAVAIPGLHLAGMAADVVFLMNRMSTTCYGIGAIMGYDNNHSNFLEEEDFPIILALWAGDSEMSAAVQTKTAADMAAKVGSKVGAKILSKTMLKGSGLLIGKKLGGKVGAKIGAKFGAKIGGKVAAGFVPFLGAVVGGGINYYFIDSISTAAEEFYDFKCEVAEQIKIKKYA